MLTYKVQFCCWKVNKETSRLYINIWTLIRNDVEKGNRIFFLSSSSSKINRSAIFLSIKSNQIKCIDCVQIYAMIGRVFFLCCRTIRKYSHRKMILFCFRFRFFLLCFSLIDHKNEDEIKSNFYRQFYALFGSAYLNITFSEYHSIDCRKIFFIV